MRNAFVALWLLAALHAHAVVPRTLHYQGHLTDASGQPFNGAVAMTFRLYAAAAGGAVLWSETHDAVNVSNGAFSVRLGDLVAIDLAFDQQYYLSVSVGADAEMAARLAVGGAAYALRASTADAAAPGSVTTGAIQDASITPGNLGDFCAPGQVLWRTSTGWQCGLLP